MKSNFIIIRQSAYSWRAVCKHVAALALFFTFVFLSLMIYSQKLQRLQDLRGSRWVHALQRSARHRRIETARQLSESLMAISPTVHCAGAVRIGGVADGGKWTCRPWLADSSCQIWSFGVGNDIAWEGQLRAVLMAANIRCPLTAVDPDAEYTSLFTHQRDANFMAARVVGASDDTRPCRSISDRRSNNSLTINCLAKLSGQWHVTFVKIDVEGAELKLLNDIVGLVSSNKLVVCQLLFELHVAEPKHSKWRTLETLRALEVAGFELFAKEANLISTDLAVEFAYIHRDCFRQFALKKSDVLTSNFATLRPM